MASTLTLEVRASLESLDGDGNDHEVTAVDVVPIGTTSGGSPVLPFSVEQTRWFGRTVKDDPLWYRSWHVRPRTDAHGVFWPMPVYRQHRQDVDTYDFPRSRSRFRVEKPRVELDDMGNEIPQWFHVVEVEITLSANTAAKTPIDANNLDVRDTEWRFTTDVGVFDVTPTSEHLDQLEAFWQAAIAG